MLLYCDDLARKKKFFLPAFTFTSFFQYIFGSKRNSSFLVGNSRIPTRKCKGREKKEKQKSNESRKGRYFLRRKDQICLLGRRFIQQPYSSHFNPFLSEGVYAWILIVHRQFMKVPKSCELSLSATLPYL